MLKNKTTDAFIQVSLDSLNTRERQAPYNSGIVCGGHDRSLEGQSWHVRYGWKFAKPLESQCRLLGEVRDWRGRKRVLHDYVRHSVVSVEEVKDLENARCAHVGHCALGDVRLRFKLRLQRIVAVKFDEGTFGDHAAYGATAGGLVSAGNAQDVGLGQLLAECRARVFLRVRAGDVAVADKHRPAVNARGSRKGNHTIKIVSGIE